MAGTEPARTAATRLFSIADAFTDGRALTLSQVSRRTGLPVSTTHRLLQEWVAWGGLVRREDGRYRVGIKLWRLGVKQHVAPRLADVARPYLLELLDITGEHVNLAIRDGLGVVYLDTLAAPGAVRIVSDVGSILPLHATAVGLVLLAHAPAETLMEVLAAGPAKLTPSTIVSDRELRARLAAVRATGIAQTVEEMTRGAFSVAAPVRDARGTVVAAVSVIAHVERVAEPHFAVGVRMTARAVSAEIARWPEWAI